MDGDYESSSGSSSSSDEDTVRSAISGRKIKKHIEKTSADLQREKSRFGFDVCWRGRGRGGF
jgi:hypothetical protein